MPPKKDDNADANKAVRFGRVRSNLKMGLVGLPNVGKSSLFNLLCQQEAEAANYPFCTINPNESRCAVPDQRFDYLCELFKPPSKIPAFLHVTDIAGLIKGASEGAGLGNAFLSHIAAVDGIFHLVRAFENDEIVHVDDSVDPVRDLDTITGELCLKDLATIDRAIEAAKVEAKRVKVTKEMENYLALLEKIKAMLEQNQPVRTGEWTTGEVDNINEKLKELITTKPMIYLVNLNQEQFIKKRSKWLPKIQEWVDAHGGGTIIPFSVEFEQKLWELREDPAGRDIFLAEAEGAKSALPRMVKVGYKQLQLIYFFTAGDPEVRCWTIPAGTLAPQAAGAIHTDFERGFIKAEVVAYDDFKAHNNNQPSMAGAKAAGKYRIEGKNYEVKDGDIIHFQFNVTAPAKKK